MKELRKGLSEADGAKKDLKKQAGKIQQNLSISSKPSASTNTDKKTA